MDFAIREHALRTFADQLGDRSIMATLLEKLMLDTHFPIANLWRREFEMPSMFLRQAQHQAPFNYDASLQLEERTPLGRVVCILPGNGPIYTLAKVLAPAFLMGNEVVFKLPTRLRQSQGIITELVQDHIDGATVEYPSEGKSRGVILREALLDPRVKAVVIFGDNTWLEPFANLAKTTATKLIFEGPGNDPAIIFPGADLDNAAYLTLKGAFYNGGQSCSATKRVYVHRELLDAFCRCLQSYVAEFKFGDPHREDVVIGPSFSPKLQARIASQMKDARERGAQLIHGEGTIDDHHIFRPTILTCDHDCRVVQEETFYSVYPIVAFDSEEEVRGYISESNYGLNASVFGQCSQAFRRFLWMSHKAVCFDSMPFSPENSELLRLVGGFKSSGFIGQWHLESPHGHCSQPLLKGDALLDGGATDDGDLGLLKYCRRSGRFYLERELSQEIVGPDQSLPLQETDLKLKPSIGIR